MWYIASVGYQTWKLTRIDFVSMNPILHRVNCDGLKANRETYCTCSKIWRASQSFISTFHIFFFLSPLKYARRNSYRIIDLSVVKRVHRKLTITRGRRMDHDRITPISSASAQLSGYRECDRLSRCIGINWNRLEILLLANTTKHDNPVTWAFISKDFPIFSWYQEQ